jgi:hypothetical protein
MHIVNVLYDLNLLLLTCCFCLNSSQDDYLFLIGFELLCNLSSDTEFHVCNIILFISSTVNYSRVINTQYI